MFFLLTPKLNLKWSNFLCNLTSWVRIETTCIETTSFHTSNIQACHHIWPYKMAVVKKDASPLFPSKRIRKDIAHFYPKLNQFKPDTIYLSWAHTLVYLGE